MAVCGLLSMLPVSPIQPDMDSCPGHSSGVTRKDIKFWQSGVGPRASSCLSSTMVDRNDPDDSGSSQPPTPTLALSESKSHMVNRGSSLPRHELELSISLSDGQRTTSPRGKSVNDDFDLASASTAREDTLGRPGVVEEEPSFSGPPRKRARMSPLGFRLEENPAGNVREQVQRHPSVSTSNAVTGVHSLASSRSLPSFLLKEREPSSSPSRNASIGSTKPGGSWWLRGGPKNSPMIPHETHHFQSAQESTRANFAIDGRGMIPGTSLQERDFPFKEPSFFPNMLSSMEASEQVRRGDDAPSAAGARSQEQGRPQAVLEPPEPPEHPFLGRREICTSRVSSISTVSEETVPRPGATIFGMGMNREGSFHDANTSYGQQTQHTFEFQGGRRRHPSASESQHVDLDRDLPQGTLSKQQQAEQRTVPQIDQRSFQSPSSGNANIKFYNRIVDAAQQPVSSPFSEGGHSGPFNPSLGFNVAGQSLPPRASSQMAGAAPVQFGGEAANSNLAQQGNADAIRNLYAMNPSMGSVPPFMSQTPNPDPVRLSFPNLSSLDFLQSLQRQSFPQGTERHRQPAPGNVAGSHLMPQGFSFLGPPQSSQHSLPAELNPAFPSRGTPSGNLQSSSGLRDFLSPQRPKGSTSLGLGRDPPIGPHGFSSPTLEIPTQLSLQGPSAPPPLTVVMEGRSIGRRVSLQDYDGYDSFAAAMKTMFDSHTSSQQSPSGGGNCTLMNAIPGYVIAYEDEEGDVLLAGDLPWSCTPDLPSGACLNFFDVSKHRDFVRMAKQIRIVSSSKISFKLPTGPLRS